MKLSFSLSLLAPLLLFLAVPTLASPHPAHPGGPPRSPNVNRRHDDPDCDSTHTYTATYTSDIVRTYTIFSVSTATETYTSLRTVSTRRAPPRTATRTKTWTEIKTQTVTDWAPAVTITVTKTQTDTDVSTRTAASTISIAAPTASAGPGGECNTGSLQCCDTVAPANSPAMSGILSAIGVGADVLNGLGDGLVGMSCSPISASSLGGGVEWCVFHRTDRCSHCGR